MISLLRGATTHENKCVEQHRRAACSLCVAALMIALLATMPAQAQVPASLTLMAAEDLALEQEPGQAALNARAKALEDQSVVAGQLPDPTLRVGIANFPIESGGFSTEGMTQAQIGLRQSFPPGNTRAARTRQYQSLAAEMSENADARGRAVLMSVRSAWLETYYWEKAHSIVSESRPFFSDLLTVTRSLYSVGSKDQQDVLRAELELSRLDDRLIDINRQRARARAELSEWIGVDSGRPIADKLPDWERAPSIDALRAAIVRHPKLRAVDAAIDARGAGVELAKESFKPGWAMDLAYGYRDGSLPAGEPRSDFVSLSVTVDLPIFRRNRQDRGLAAALSERHAVSQSRDALLRTLNSQLDSEYARWQDLSRRVDLYDRLILNQTRDLANAALASYQSETGDFADVMRGFIDQLDTQLDLIRLKVDRAQSYSVLADLGGLPR